MFLLIFLSIPVSIYKSIYYSQSLKINAFSLIPYHLTLTSTKKQTPQPFRISPASTTGFWNELYFYRANFIIMEWSLFVLFSCIFPCSFSNLFINPGINISLNTIINLFLNPFKIIAFSLIPYSLTLTILTLTPYPFSLIKTQTPQQIRISPASATGFWNKLYFYGANFIIMESTLFELYIII